MFSTVYIIMTKIKIFLLQVTFYFSTRDGPHSINRFSNSHRMPPCRASSLTKRSIETRSDDGRPSDGLHLEFALDLIAFDTGDFPMRIKGEGKSFVKNGNSRVASITALVAQLQVTLNRIPVIRIR